MSRRARLIRRLLRVRSRGATLTINGGRFGWGTIEVTINGQKMPVTWISYSETP